MAKPDKNERVAYVDDLYFRGNQARWMFMSQWLQNYHFFVGNQWVRWVGDKRDGQWEAGPQIEGKIQYTANKIHPASRMMVGRMLKDQQLQRVIQAQNDEQAIDAAKAATRFLEYIWRQTEGDRIKKEVATWSTIAGIGITKTYVDLSKGPTNKKTGKPDGDICVNVLSPFEFVVPPNARYMDKLPWAMHARMETREWVYEEFGVEVESAGTANEWTMYQSAVLNITTDGAFFGSNTTFESDTVLVKELWVRPCRDWPKGRVLIVAGAQIVFDDDIPWDKCYWPFNYLPFFDVPFRFWPMSMIEPMIDTQKALNNVSSQILENIKYMGNNIILAPMGAVDPDELVAEPGAIWPYNPAAGGAPAFVAPNPVSAEVFNEKSLLETQIYDLAGIHMLGSGSGIRAAAAFMLLEQQDETEFLPISQNVEAFLKRDAELKLFLAQKAFDTPRKIKILGEEGQWEVQDFNAADLTGDEEVEIQSKQEFANDKATRFNQTLQLIQARDENGQPYLDRQSVLKILDIEGLDGIMTDFDLDYNRAKFENEQMLAKKTVEVNDFDDHATHIKIHNQTRKRIDFEKLPQPVQDAFTQHVLAHQQMLQQQSPQQTVAKGDQTPSQPAFGQQPMQRQQNPLGGVPRMPGFNAASSLQSGVDATHNLISKV